jgi:hypothetical protein
MTAEEIKSKYKQDWIQRALQKEVEECGQEQ